FSKENTVIVQRPGSLHQLSARVKRIRAEGEHTPFEFAKRLLQERLDNLIGGVSFLILGAASETELKVRILCCDDALDSTRAPVEEGIVSGGGTALINVYKQVSELDLSDDEATGANIVLRALEEPVRQIAENAGLEGSIVVERLKGEEVGV